MAFNEKKFAAFYQRVNKSNNIKLFNFIKQVGKDYTLECQYCKKSCFLYEYGQEKKSKYGFRFKQCTKCRDQSRDPFGIQITHMKRRTRIRNRKGRNHESVFYDIQTLKELFDKQKGLCYYSGEPMKTNSRILHDPNQMSIERLDDNLGYIEGNCVFVCLKNQLTTKKMGADVKKQIVKQSTNPTKPTLELNWTEKDFETKIVRPAVYKKRTTMERNGITVQQCNKCEQFEELTEFSKKRNTISTICKRCTNTCVREILNTPRGFVIKMVNSAKLNAKERARKEKRDDDSGDVDENLFDIVVDKIIAQKGCCAVTGTGFIFNINSPYQPSIDRLDNSRGYIKENIRIVISPINNIGRKASK